MMNFEEFGTYLKKEGPSIMAEIKANRAKLDGCAQHKFEIVKPAKMGAKHHCLNCGGELGLTEIGWYLRGFVAHGGKADDIVPGWNG